MTEMVDLKELSEEQFHQIAIDVINGETTLQEVKGFSQEQMEAIYSVAYNFYQVGKYQDATQVFSWLGLFNPFVPKYWMGLGASLQMAKEFERALHAYAVAALTSEPEDPTPHLHAGECYLGTGNLEEALKAFQMAVDFGRDKEKYKKVYDKANALSQILKEKKEGDNHG